MSLWLWNEPECGAEQCEETDSGLSQSMPDSTLRGVSTLWIRGGIWLVEVKLGNMHKFGTSVGIFTYRVF